MQKRLCKKADKYITVIHTKKPELGRKEHMAIRKCGEQEGQEGGTGNKYSQCYGIASKKFLAVGQVTMIKAVYYLLAKASLVQ